jgi:hypothetical protein
MISGRLKRTTGVGMTGDAFRAIQGRLAKFQESGNSALLLDAIALEEIADLRQSIGWPAFAALPDNPGIRRGLNAIVLAGTFLWMRAQRLPIPDQLDARLEATELLAAAYAVVPAAIPRPLAKMLGALTGGGRALDHAALHDHAIDELTNAARGTDLPAIDHAIWLLMCAVQVAAGDRFQTYYLSDLGTAWLDRFRITGRIRDLDNSVTAHEQGLATSVDVPVDQAGRLSNYSAALLARFGQRQDTRDLSRALDTARSAVRLSGALPADQTPRPDHSGPHPVSQSPGPDRAARLARLASLSRLSEALLASFEQHRRRADLDDAVRARRQAADLAPPGDPGHSRQQASLAQALLDRLALSLDSLDEAELAGVAAAEAVVEAPIAETRAAVEADLAEATAAAEAATATAPPRPAARSPGLAALARAFTASYALSGNARDLEQAITSGRAAVAAADEAAAARNVSFGHALSLAELGKSMQLRYEHAADASALDDAIAMYGRALEIAPITQSERRRFLAALGNTLQTRFSTAGNAADIRKSVTVLSEALAATRPDAPARLDAAASLARSLVLAAYAGDAAGLDQAVTLLQRELGSAGAADPGRPAALAVLGWAWRTWFDAAGDDEPMADHGPLGRAAAAFRRAAAALPPGHPRHAEYQAGLGSVLRRRFECTGDEPTARAAIAASTAAAHAPAACPRIRARAAADWGRVAARLGDADEAAAGFATAVGLLGQVAGQPPRRDHVDPLGRPTTLTCDAAAWAITAGHPEQAVELLEHGRGVLLSRSLGADSRDLQQADPPLPFAVLRAAAAGGPVVIINVSAYRCDALTVTPAGVQVTGLPALTAAEASGRATDFVVALLRRHGKDPAKRAAAQATLTQTLAWLWDTVITPLQPVLEAITTPTPDGTLPRLWWCPSGPLTFLPLHAAARPGEPDHAVAARFVSSYAPTLSLLRLARAAGPAAGDSGRPLVVAHPAGPGRGFRPGARQEGRTLARRLGGAVLLRGSRATTAAVTQRLAAGAPWVHVACRGTQDVGDPAAGQLALHGGPLRAGEISGLGLAGAELAVLPACEAVLGGTRLADEAVTLAAAFARAGYRHVIGTLWRPDGDAAVAEQVYDELGAPGGPAAGAAAALHRVTETLRHAHPDDPWRWAAYIHIGP